MALTKRRVKGCRSQASLAGWHWQMQPSGRSMDLPVRWVECMQAAAALAPGATFVEAGPGNVLSGLLKRIVPGSASVTLGTADEVARFLA